MRELGEKEYEKDSTISLAQRILEKAHPDAVSVIKHWITIIQSRWDEVSTWAKQVCIEFFSPAVLVSKVSRGFTKNHGQILFEVSINFIQNRPDFTY